MAALTSVRQREVSVYCTSWCPHSRRAKMLLDRAQIPYANIDIETNPAAAKQVEAWNDGYRSVPTMTFHLIMTEPSTAELKQVFLDARPQVLSLTAYVTNWCPDCRRTLNWLRQYRVDFNAVDIEQAPQAAAQVRAWNKGMQSVPTLDLTLRLTEPTSEQIEAVLGLQGW